MGPAALLRSAKSGQFAASSGLPAPTIEPPSGPAPGPTSMSQSAPADHRFVMFDDEHGIAQIAQFETVSDQLFGIAGMQAGGRSSRT